MKLLPLVLLVLGLLSGCTKAEKVEQPVNVAELHQQFIGAWNDKSSDKIISQLADDVQFVQGNAHYRGKEEVGREWVRATLPTLADLKTNVVSSGTDTQLAYQGGTFSVDVLPSSPGQPEGVGEGNFLFIWKRAADGSWKLSYAQLEDLPVLRKQ